MEGRFGGFSLRRGVKSPVQSDFQVVQDDPEDSPATPETLRPSALRSLSASTQPSQSTTASPEKEEYVPDSPRTAKRKEEEIDSLLGEVGELYNFDKWKDTKLDDIKRGRSLIQYAPGSPSPIKLFKRQPDTPAPLRIEHSRAEEWPTSLRRKASIIGSSFQTPVGTRRKNRPRSKKTETSNGGKLDDLVKECLTPPPLTLSDPSKKKLEPRPAAAKEGREGNDLSLREFLAEQPLNPAEQKHGRSLTAVKKTNDRPDPLKPAPLFGKVPKLSVTIPEPTEASHPIEGEDHQPLVKYADPRLAGATAHRMPPKKGSKRVKTDDGQAPKSKPGKLQRSKATKNLLETDDGWRSSKSKVANADLNAYFQNPLAWDLLDETEKNEIRALLPPSTPYDEDGRPSMEFLKYNNDWRDSVRNFQNDLREGRYENEWREEAVQAMAERAAGEFDEWKEEQFEEYWGQKTKLNPREFSNEMARVTLEEMIAASTFEVGDVWSYSRPFGRGKAAFLVEKHVKIIGICSDNKLVFSIPIGQLKYNRLPKGLNTVIESPISPQSSTVPPSGTHGTSVTTADTNIHDPFHIHPGKEWKPDFSMDENKTAADGASWMTVDNASTVLDTGDAHPGSVWKPPFERAATSSLKLGPSMSGLPAIPSTSSFNPTMIFNSLRRKSVESNRPSTSDGSPAKAAAAQSRTSPTTTQPFQFPPRTTSRPQSQASRHSAFPERPLSRTSNRAIKSEYPQSERPLSRSSNRPHGPRPLASRPNHSRTPSATSEGQTHTVDNLSALEHKILEIDGRTEQKKAVGGTEMLWKSVRVYREMGPGRDVLGSRKDLGSLWECRKRFWLGRNPYVRVPALDESYRKR
ncbi:MAG: hypothetical protein MMC23_005893 [Stictis urceolatum]|nr:hypothetical protein [Stictis urceolata]